MSLFNIKMKDNLVEQQIVKMNKKSEISSGKKKFNKQFKNESNNYIYF